MAPRKCKPSRITVYGYVRQHQGVKLDDLIRNVVVKRQFRRRLPITGEFKINDKRLTTLRHGGAWRLFTNDHAGLMAAHERGVPEAKLGAFSYYQGITDWSTNKG